MPERPGDPPSRARALADRERAEAAKQREIAKKAPPLSVESRCVVASSSHEGCASPRVTS